MIFDLNHHDLTVPDPGRGVKWGFLAFLCRLWPGRAPSQVVAAQDGPTAGCRAAMEGKAGACAARGREVAVLSRGSHVRKRAWGPRGQRVRKSTTPERPEATDRRVGHASPRDAGGFFHDARGVNDGDDEPACAAPLCLDGAAGRHRVLADGAAERGNMPNEPVSPLTRTHTRQEYQK